MATKILWVVPRPFLPVCDGASKANHALLMPFLRNSLKVNEINIDLLLFGFNEDLKTFNPEVYKSNYRIVNLFLLKKERFHKGLSFIFQVLFNFLFSKNPITADFFNLKINKKNLERVFKNKYDYILLEGPHPYNALKNYLDQDQKIIYRSHNVEYKLWENSGNNLLKKIIIKLQYKRMKDFELGLVERSSFVLCISDEDQKIYEESLDIIPKTADKIQYFPMAIDFKKNQKVKEDVDSLNILFLGKLDWQPNSEGLRWFFDDVYPLLDNSIQVKIVGKGDFPRHLYTFDNVQFLGFVENLDTVFDWCDVSIIPILSGSGTRIKVLDALAAGSPILSTVFGVQGSGVTSDHAFLEDQAEEWASLLNNWPYERAFEMVKFGQKELSGLYGIQRGIDFFSNLK